MNLDLDYFKTKDFHTALRVFFKNLNIPVNYIAEEPVRPRDILTEGKTYKTDHPAFQLMKEVYFLGMIDDAAFEGSTSLAPEKIESDYDGILIFGVTLNPRDNGLLPTRSQLAEITRSFNREYHYTPVVVVFKYENQIAFANAQRLKYKQEWREGEKAGKVSLLRDIDLDTPHRGHTDILSKLAISRSGKKAVNSFADLYAYWQEVFNVSLLNKKFYAELSNWYFWAIKEVSFPDSSVSLIHKLDEKEKAIKQEHNAKNVIRLLTRFLFVWFIKEKKLIPEVLFDHKYLKREIIKDLSPFHEEGLFKTANIKSHYYKAILQNLFFATLNQETRQRAFRRNGQNMNVTNLMRYEGCFKDAHKFIELVESIVPFMNGGLFECLDKPHPNKKGPKGGDVIVYKDGFSDRNDNPLKVPDYLFFGTNEEVDLSSVIGITNKKTKQAGVKGLINIFESYKFTIAENTPIEEDVALDPELLGKVFENLLASYNPETKTTARKQTGSFYTPREIVNYMVDESLIAYLKSTVSFQLSGKENSQKQDAFATFLNPNDEIIIKQGNLPHWTQDNVWYFITFRLADSIPQEKIEQLKREQEQWFQNHRKENRQDYTKDDLKEYYHLFSERVEAWMNAGYGDCVLKDENNVKIVSGALKYFEGKRYQLDEWVVMPNHVHVLVKPIDNNNLSDILHSWKSFTANKINKNTGKTGQLWMHESYDHIVRNEKAFSAIKNYIRQNPEKAKIKVSKASSFESAIVVNASNFESDIVVNASSFETTHKSMVPVKKDSKQDALDTLLHQLLSFDAINPFAENDDLQKQIIHALDTCKILDPACGSGAFPMGILQKMVHVLQKVDPKNEHWRELQMDKALKDTESAFHLADKDVRKQKLDEINEAFDKQVTDPDYARKLFLIEDCIYGVDIQPIAAQISKLRFFISLVVDQKVDKTKDNFGIRPLPNLETKFVAANTLIGIEKPKKQGRLFESQEVKGLEEDLKNVRHRIFSAKTPSTKRKLREEDQALREKMGELLTADGWTNKTARQLAEWDPYDQNASSPFFDPEWMFGIKDGFDVVIGNPPYVQIQKFSGQQCQKDWESQNYKTYVKTGDIYSLFYEKGYSVLKKGGHLCFITSNKWMKAKYGKATRDFFLKHTIIRQLIDFGDSPIFEAATTYTNILIFAKDKAKGESKAWDLSRVYQKETFLDTMIQHSVPSNAIFSIESFLILPQHLTGIKNQIEAVGVPLKEWDISIYRGVLTGFNEAFIIPKAKRDMFIATDSKSAEILQPVLRGKDIKRYKANFADLWLINSHNGYFDNENNKQIEPVNIDLYPVIKKHLETHWKTISQRQDKGITPYNLRNCAYVDKFEINKIIWIEMSPVSNFTFSNDTIFVLNTAYILTGNSLKYILALLNSSLLSWYFPFISTDVRGHTRRYIKQYVENLPVAKIAKQEQRFFEELVDLIFFAKAKNLEFEAINIESIIDALVFQLYFPAHMKEKQIDILQFVKKDLAEVMKDREFNQLPDNEKENIINQLHSRWTHPDSEVPNRINLFAVRSPDILKPIIEPI